MFREPTQAEIDYLWSYLKQKEERTVNELNNRTGWYSFCGYVALGMGAICLLGFQLIGVIFFGLMGFFLINYGKNKDNVVQHYVNEVTSNPYNFQIADCVLETVIPNYDNYLIDQNPSYVNTIARPNVSSEHRHYSNGGVQYGSTPFCKVVMSNGDTVCCAYQTTPYAEQKGITWRQNTSFGTQYLGNVVQYSQPAYFIKTNSGFEDFVIVNPNY